MYPVYIPIQRHQVRVTFLGIHNILFPQKTLGGILLSGEKELTFVLIGRAKHLKVGAVQKKRIWNIVICKLICITYTLQLAQ